MRNSTILLLALILFFGGTAIYSSFEFNSYYDKVISSRSSNILDGEFEIGHIDTSTGLPTENPNRFRSINFSKVKPNTQYVISASNPSYRFNLYQYDENKNLISAILFRQTYGTITKENTHYIKIVSVDSNDLNIQVWINEGTTKLPYEPYWVNYEKVLSEKRFLNDYNQESKEYGSIVENGFKNAINVIKETTEFLKDSIPSKDNILGPIGAVIKRLKELFPSFFMPNPIIK